jgi:hypothetical protein
MARPNGYRYLRVYTMSTGSRHALYEVMDGQAVRVGTVDTYPQGHAFISYEEDHEGENDNTTDYNRGT